MPQHHRPVSDLVKSPAAEKAKRTLAALIDDGRIDRALAVLDECLVATRRVRSPHRAPGGGVTYEDVPDYRVRMAAAKTLLEFRHGKPHQAIRLSTDDAAGRQRGREEVVQALMSDWDRTKRIAETWIEGMKRAENPEVIDVDPLV